MTFLYKAIEEKGEIKILTFMVINETTAGYKVWDQYCEKERYVSKTKQQYAWPTKLKALTRLQNSVTSRIQTIEKDWEELNAIRKKVDDALKETIETGRVSKTTS